MSQSRIQSASPGWRISGDGRCSRIRKIVPNGTRRTAYLTAEPPDVDPRSRKFVTSIVASSRRATSVLDKTYESELAATVLAVRTTVDPGAMIVRTLGLSTSDPSLGSIPHD